MLYEVKWTIHSNTLSSSSFGNWFQRCQTRSKRMMETRNSILRCSVQVRISYRSKVLYTYILSRVRMRPQFLKLYVACTLLLETWLFLKYAHVHDQNLLTSNDGFPLFFVRIRASHYITVAWFRWLRWRIGCNLLQKLKIKEYENWGILNSIFAVYILDADCWYRHCFSYLYYITTYISLLHRASGPYCIIVL